MSPAFSSLFLIPLIFIRFYFFDFTGVVASHVDDQFAECFAEEFGGLLVDAATLEADVVGDVLKDVDGIHEV